MNAGNATAPARFASGRPLAYNHPPRMDRSLRNRLTFGPLMLVGLFLLLWVDDRADKWTRPYMDRLAVQSHHHPTGSGIGGIGLMVVLMLILPLATDELATLLTAERVRPYRFISAAGSAALVLHAFLTQFYRFQPIAASTLMFVVVFTMLFAALRRAWEKETQLAIVRMAGTVLTTLYLGGLGWFLMAIRVKHSEHFSGSTMVILMILLVVKSTDIGAYAGGRTLGRRKLIPWLSPGKTWEGLAFGIATAALVSLGISRFVHTPQALPWWNALLFGAVIGFLGQVGDLLESLMKRDAEVKDSGRLIPGFGGVLDVIDSPMFAAPFAYLWFSLVFRG